VILKKTLPALICIFALIFSNVAIAGDFKPAGTVLEEESYVLTKKEATDLMNRLKLLELKELELNKYKSLESLRLKQIDLYKINLEYSQAQNTRYVNLLGTNQDLLDRYSKRDQFQTWENFGYLALGITLTIGAFFAADAITDSMERN
jgi:thiamine pyrophosphate-dependent acetolactate synthase large subunit-like protein